MLHAIRQKTSVRLSGEQLAPQAQFSIAGPAFAFQVLRLGSCWLALRPRPAPHPPFPSFLPWLQEQTCVCGPQAPTSPNSQVPSPGAALGSLPIPHNVLLSLPVLMSRLFSIANLCCHRPISPALTIAVHTPLPRFSSAPPFCPRAVAGCHPCREHFTGSYRESPL